MKLTISCESGNIFQRVQVSYSNSTHWPTESC